MAVLLLAEMNGAELSLDATAKAVTAAKTCLLYTSPSPRD